MNTLAIQDEDEMSIRTSIAKLADRLVAASSLAKEVAELRDQVERLTNLVGTLVAERDEMRQSRDKAVEELRVARAHIEDEQARWNIKEGDYRRQASFQEARIDALTVDNQNYVTNLADLRTLFDTHKATIQGLERTVSDVKGYAGRLEDELFDLSARLEAGDKLVKSWEESSKGLFEEMRETLFPPKEGDKLVNTANEQAAE